MKKANDDSKQDKAMISKMIAAAEKKEKPGMKRGGPVKKAKGGKC